MTDPVLFGAAYSVYTRIARLALTEKGVSHRFEEVDIFDPAGPPADYRGRHPFGRIPAFAHDGLDLYETAAICRYVDEAFPGPALQPPGPRGRARVAQLVGVLDSYGYRPMVWDVFVERVRQPAKGVASDEARIAEGVAKTDLCLSVLDGFIGDGAWLAGPDAPLSLADLHAAPMVAYLRVAPEGAAALARYPRLAAWWDRLAARPSMLATRSPLEPSAG